MRLLERLRPRTVAPRPFAVDATADAARRLFAFLEDELGFAFFEREGLDEGFSLTYKNRSLRLGVTVGAQAGRGAFALAHRLDVVGRLRPGGREGWEVGDLWHLTHTIGLPDRVEPDDPATGLETIAETLSRRRRRLLRSAGMEGRRG